MEGRMVEGRGGRMKRTGINPPKPQKRYASINLHVNAQMGQPSNEINTYGN
jgi:hypothetical protein